jgi:mannose-1-phosphate guanylyltransferase / phosphomannomutase
MKKILGKRPAVFLDRDGTINEEVDVLRDVKKLRLIRNAGKAITEINRLGYLAIVITNQPVIARGWLTHEGLGEVHDALRSKLARSGARLDAIYYCPHHPNANLPEYRKVCKCRKPGIKMFQDAAKDFDIDMKKSYMVGDHTRDILSGKNAGVTTIMVATGHGGKDGANEVTADYDAKDLLAAVGIIKKQDRITKKSHAN